MLVFHLVTVVESLIFFSYFSFKFVVGCVLCSLLDLFCNFGGADSWRWCGSV